MHYLMDALHNDVLISTAIAWCIAQVAKVVIDFIQNGFNPKRLTGSGGMPSSHSATVTGLAVSTAIVYGLGGFEFVIALFFAIIVIYDAQGVRMETGREAYALNRLRKRDIENGVEPAFENELEEKMGHTMPEIIAGIIIGAVTAIVYCRYI